MNQCSNPFQIDSPKISIDSYAKKVLEELKEHLTKTKGDWVEILTQSRWTTQITKLSKRLNEACLDDITRLLLSQQEIYAIAICRATGYDQKNEEQKQKIFNDIDGLYSEVRCIINDKEGGIKTYFLALLVGEVLDTKGYNIANREHPEWGILDDLILAKDIPIRSGKVEPAVMEIWCDVSRYGEPMYYLDQYIDRDRDLKKANPSTHVKRLMIDYLIDKGIKIDGSEKYSSYIVQAYREVTNESVLCNPQTDRKSDGIIKLINQIKFSIEQVEKDLENMSGNQQQTLELQKTVQEIENIRTNIKNLEDRNDQQQKAIDRLEQDNINNKKRIGKLEENDQKLQKLIAVLSNINISVDGLSPENKPDTGCSSEPIPQSNKDAIIKILGL